MFINNPDFEMCFRNEMSDLKIGIVICHDLISEEISNLFVVSLPEFKCKFSLEKYINRL